MVGVVVEQASSLDGLAFFVLPVRDDVKRTRVNPLNKIPHEQRISLEAGRIPDNVRLGLAGAGVGSLLDLEEIGVLCVGAVEVPKKPAFDVGRH